MFSSNFIDNLLRDSLCVIADIVIPDSLTEAYCDAWAQLLFEEKSFSSRQLIHGSFQLEGHDRLFIEFFLQMSKLFFELGRLPVFDDLNIIYLQRNAENAKKYTLKIEVFMVNFIPQSVYVIPIKESLDVCLWMTQNAPTLENRDAVFNVIKEKVINPLHQVVSAGKSTIPLLKCAHALGIPFVHLGLGVYQFGWGSKARRLDRSICELDSAIGAKLTQNKVSTANILRLAGLPSPVHSAVTTEMEALTVARQLGFPVVVKPTDLDRGEGVTVDVFDEEGVKNAFANALVVSKSRQVIIERQVCGVCHRLFIANDRLLYAVKRHPMSVVGDGKRTVVELVDAELREQNKKPPWKRSEIKPIDDLALETLSKIGLVIDSVPAAGMLVSLRRIESTDWGGVDEEVTYFIHPENFDIALRASKLFGLKIAGVDIISSDITKPWHENGAIINEVNFAPLFGGAEISRSHISEFFSEFIEGDGKIPVEVFEREIDALKFQRQCIERKQRCYITSADKTVDALGKEVVMPLNDLKQRVRALVLRPDVDAISILKTV